MAKAKRVVRKKARKTSTAKKATTRKTLSANKGKEKLAREKWRVALQKLAKEKKDAKAKMTKLKADFTKKLKAECAKSYEKGRADEQKEQQKKETAREKLVKSTLAKFEKKFAKKKPAKKKSVKRKAKKTTASKATTKRRGRPAAKKRTVAKKK